VAQTQDSYLMDSVKYAPISQELETMVRLVREMCAMIDKSSWKMEHVKIVHKAKELKEHTETDAVKTPVKKMKLQE